MIKANQVWVDQLNAILSKTYWLLLWVEGVFKTCVKRRLHQIEKYNLKRNWWIPPPPPLLCSKFNHFALTLEISKIVLEIIVTLSESKSVKSQSSAAELNHRSLHSTKKSHHKSQNCFKIKLKKPKFYRNIPSKKSKFCQQKVKRSNLKVQKVKSYQVKTSFYTPNENPREVCKVFQLTEQKV